MNDLISRQAAIDAIKGLLDSMLETDTLGFYEIENVLFEVPSAEPERKKGEWVGYNTDKGDEWKRTDGSPVFMSCSICNELVLNNGAAHWNFCSCCGADMRGKSDEI